jgi:xylulokinase
MFLLGQTLDIVVHPVLWSAPGVYPAQHTLAAGMSTAGSAVEWFRQIAGSPSVESLDAEAADRPNCRAGLIFLPYLAGERSPIHDPDARGVVIGLTLGTSRGDIYRAVLEGVAMGVRHNLEAMHAARFHPARVTAVGGGTASRLWPRIVSSAIGLPIELPRLRVGAAFGDAKLAAVGSGLIAQSYRWNRTDSVLQPDAADAERLDMQYALFLATHEATRAQHSLTERAREEANAHRQAVSGGQTRS